MEEEIKRTAKRLGRAYLLFWLLPVLFVVAGEVGGNWVGSCAANERALFAAENVCILLAVICVPLSLKLFAVLMQKRVDTLSFPQALRLYRRISLMRLLLLWLPAWLGLAVYYLMLSNTGVLCALIALTASLFCRPGEERLRRELNIYKEEDERA